MSHEAPISHTDPTQAQLQAARHLITISGTEGDVEHAILRLTGTMSVSAPKSKPLKDWQEPDLVYEEQRLIVEVKKPGRAKNPDDPTTGSRHGESAFQQLNRYVRTYMNDERSQLQLTEHIPWLGVLSDGRNWHVWTWRKDGRTAEVWQSSLHAVRGQEHELVIWMRQCLYRTYGRPVVPDNPYESLFQPYLMRLRVIGHRREPAIGRDVIRTIRTQRKLWYEMLQGSGIVPSDEQSFELFINHSFLVTVARAVISATTSNTPQNPSESLSDGFVSWITLSEEGAEWAEQVFSTAHRFDWRSQPRDVLREMYEAVIDVRDRKIFGEYYTPDWLAGMIVERVCDLDWCQQSIHKAIIERGLLTRSGVLDPACGSGTFLFHVAKRLVSQVEEQKLGLTAQQVSDCVARLVYGVDIHPVAVEISRATLLRALPAVPSTGVAGIMVYTGDSLLTPTGERQLFETDDKHIEVRTPKNASFVLPWSFIQQLNYGQAVKRFVDAAISRTPVPADLTHHLSEQDTSTVGEARRQLSDIIDKEGNGVWSWFLANNIAAQLLAQRKVDRIVANPPWVTLSQIQVENRKQILQDLVSDEGLGRKRRGAAPGYAASFDIAALFVWRCGNRFMRDGSEPEHYAAGWVTNAAAIRAGNWRGFREKFADKAESLDLASIRPIPFSGAKCCVWYEGQAAESRGEGKKLVNRSKTQTDIYEEVDSVPGTDPSDNRDSASRLEYHIFRQHSGWGEVKDKVEERAVSGGYVSPSGYVDGDGKAQARSGSKHIPSCLVVVDELQDNIDVRALKGQVAVVTKKSRHLPWKSLGSISTFEYRQGRLKSPHLWVPEHWITETLFSKRLLVFTVMEPLDNTIIPNENGKLVRPIKDDNPFWDRAQNMYRNHRSKGSYIPDTLAGMLDYLGHLSAQWDHLCDTEAWNVVYNKSGQYLRAARIQRPIIVNETCYWMRVTTADEAAYLTCLLNSEALQQDFRWSRESDRHFDTHLWKKVPIPKFDADDDDHKQLVRLCSEAEEIAIKAREASLGGQIKVSNAIRKALRNTIPPGDRASISAQIDAVARRIVV